MSTEAMKRAGAQLANVAYNWAQQPGHALTSDDVVLLDKLRREWDDACRALSAQPPVMPAPCNRDRNSYCQCERTAMLCDGVGPQPPAPSVPGWQWVPVKVCAAMNQAADKVPLGDKESGEITLSWGEYEALYAAMLTAAPPPVRERLTDEAMLDLAEPLRPMLKTPADWGLVRAYARAIERAHGIGERALIGGEG